ncbi:YcaO-like family protein [Actinomyces israelii]|uniref:YcaO-like family protein n=1 Tax=Actinomyces israelii TaxID=1659 RepID=A0ABT4I9H9_9ACTO|nr:YcaO-like family protein [Actinomyces israelii]MCZ0857733.1 YcaO-like family protein [Actinomyces israelii]WKR20310.1 hypothetical protein AIF0345_0181 [Actinomyces israelii]
MMRGTLAAPTARGYRFGPTTALGAPPAVWDLENEVDPPPGTRVFRSERTLLVWPAWAAGIEGAYALLRTRWAATRSPIVQGQYSLGNPLLGRRDLVPRRRADAEGLQALADVLSPSPVRLGTGWRVPVWELDIVTSRIRRGELAVLVGETGPTRSDGSGPLRRRGLDDLPLDPEALINPVCGMVAADADQRLDWETTAPVAGQTPVWNDGRVRPLTWSGQAASYARSRTAAMLESLERVVGSRQHTGTTVLAAQADLAASGREHRVPGDFGDYGPAAYRDIMVPFSPHDPHEWVASESLRDGRAVLVPRDLAFFGQPLSTSRWAMVCSSGVATGSTRQEAIVFGLMELIERDAFVNSWYARVPGRRIDAESVPGLRPLLTRASLLGHRIELLSLPSETGLPIMVAVARATSAAAVGAAAHPEPARAARCAVEEAWTYLPERTRAVEADRARCLELRRDPSLVREIDDHPLQCLLPEGAEDLDDYLGDGPALPLDEVVTVGPLARMGAAELLSTLVGSLGRIGVEPLAVRCTAPVESALGLETWSVLAPGLAPLDFGWHRQRVLTMRRPFDYSRHVGAVAPDRLRDRPHPFS